MAEDQLPYGLRVVCQKITFIGCSRSEVRTSFDATINGVPCIVHRIRSVSRTSALFSEADSTNELKKECKHLGKLRHPNILQYLGVHCDKGGHAIITEQLHTSLDVYLASAQDGDGFPINLKLSVLRDVARGLQYLRSQSPIIVHRELFAENVHLGFDMRAKISVVGVSIPFDTERVKSTDVAMYLPPEASEVGSNPFHVDSTWDIYSFGILSIYTAMHKLPSKGESVIEWMSGMGMEHPLYELVCRCVKDYPPARLSIDGICHDLDSLCEKYPNKITDILQCDHVELMEKQKTYQSQPGSTTSGWFGTSMAGIGTLAGIGSRMLTAVVGKVVDTKKCDSPVDKDTCMSQISCQPTIVDGNEWLGVSKTKNPEDIKGDDDIAATLHQMQAYKEDFENERKDRVSACVKLNECKEQLEEKDKELAAIKVQLQEKDQELADIKAQLQSVKDKLGALEEIKIDEKKKLTADLEEAKEEIAVKVAQVKQYQKQVEAYKHQSANQLSHPEGMKRGKGFNNSEPHRHQPDVQNEQARRDSILKPCVGANANVEKDGSPVHQNGATSQSSWEQMDTPLDPNLTCLICRLTFKKGEIQLYRQHAQHCNNGLSS